MNPSEIRTYIGSNIKRLAKARGLSLFRLAVLSRVGTASLYRAVRGESWPSDAWLSRIAKTLDVTVSDIVGASPKIADSAFVRTIASRKMTLDSTAKDTTFQIRLSPHDRAQLEAVAAATSLSAAGLIRSLVAREARALGVVIETSKPTKKRGKR